MQKSIIIIGGGLSGLSAGCYGQMNGYRTAIFEMHDKAGGVCTAWQRRGYTIDGAMNWLVGTNPQSPYYRFWEELGAAPGWKIHNHDFYTLSEDREGRTFRLYCDADRFEQYLIEMAPEDSALIRDLTDSIRAAAGLNLPVEKPVELYDEADRAKADPMLPFMQTMQKWGNATLGDFARRLQNPELRRTLENAPPWPLGMLCWVLGLQHAKNAGYVIGGAEALVRPIEKRYRDLGGEINFRARVSKILVENERAVGIRLADGREFRADYVISAGDGRTAIFDLLEGRYLDENLKKMYENPVLFSPLVYVGLGIKRKFEEIPSSVGGYSYPLEKPLNIAGREEKALNMLVYNFDPTLAPEGKTVVVVSFETDYDYWKQLRADPTRYKAEKEQIARAVIAGLEQKFPGLTAQVEMQDVATPISWERYTGNWRGAYEGWMFGAYPYIPKTLPGLQNFYMAGQWVNAGGGMPTAVMSGNHTLQFICKNDQRPFVVSKPE